jgi:Kdo2-lipid IVA lauroyltransferase/acyltransferase
MAVTPNKREVAAYNSLGARTRRAVKAALNSLVGPLAVGILRLMRLVPPERLSRTSSAFMRKLGPWLREHRIGRDNLAAAFPEKTPAEIDAILMGVWDNLGRVGAEFAHMDKIWSLDPDSPENSRIQFGPGDAERFIRLRDDGKGALIFAAHLGNWEMPALAGPAYGMESAVLFRRPNVAAVDRAIQDIRGVNMGELIATTADAPMRLLEAVRAGKHVGMLVDQYFRRGVDVTFFGRTTKANPLLARIARHVDVPIHGVRIVRLSGGKFSAALTEEVAPVRDASGEVDVQATTQKITSVIEGWIRNYPDQWLWLHRRWR